MPIHASTIRPRLLSVNFFPAFSPASSGGELRFLNLYRALSRYYDIDLVTSTNFDARYEEIWHTPSLRELRFPKDAAWHRGFQTLDEAGVEGDLSGLAFALAVNEPDCVLRVAALELAANADIVVHEFPYSEPIFRDIRPKIEIYNSHNFEAGLLSSIVLGEGVGRCFQKLLRLERNLATRAALVFATSEEDGEKFRLLYGVAPDRLRYCPNGYSELELAPIEAARRRHNSPVRLERANLLFMGSSHRPNVDAASFLVELATTLPQCDFTIAGKASSHLTNAALPNNVSLVESFNGAGKTRLIEAADVFLNPVIHGSGTSLKAVEALASFLPMVTTPEGVRGLGLQSGKHAMICERSDFSSVIGELLAHPGQLDKLAESGLALAREKFSWTSIARGLSEDLSAVSVGSSRRQAKRQLKMPPRPFVVALNDYAVGKVRSGGAVRVTQMLRSIGADVVLITFGANFDVTLIEPNLLQLTIAKSPAHQAFEQSVNRGQKISVNDIVSALFVGSYHLLDEVLAQLVPRANAIIFEHCYMAPALDFLGKSGNQPPVVYNAHNIEATIKEALLLDHPLRAPLVRFVQDIELRLAKTAHLIVTCTEADATYFKAFGPPVLVVANGCTLPAMVASPSFEAVPKVGFLGSAHPPNVEAARYIIETLAPAFGNATFEFVGGVCDALADPLPANVLKHGILDEHQKSKTLMNWSLALNPVLVGGGSSLKLPDYMAHRLASISTPPGARGFDIGGSSAGIVIEREELSAALERLLDDAELRETYGRNALRYAEERLSWGAATAPLRLWLKQAARGASAEAPLPSLLVVTYRYTEPPLGGAEEYLIEVVRWLRPRFRVISLAAVDVVGPLTNHHHFGCGFKSGDGAARVQGELFDQVNLFPPDVVPEETCLAAARRLEHARMHHQRDLYEAFRTSLLADEKPVLMSGFYWPEKHGGDITRWTSSEFTFLVPGRARVFDFAGWTPRRKELAVFAVRLGEDGSREMVELCRQEIEYEFSCALALDGHGVPAGMVILCIVDEHNDEKDHRPLGVFLTKASALLLRKPSAPGYPSSLRPPLAPLDEANAIIGADIEAFIRTEHFEKWIDQLCRLANARSEEEEHDFASVRGPHSARMQAWIAEHAASFDTVLIQGIPFDVVPSTVETLKDLNRPPRIVVLPHFHGDDGFYYWRRYLSALARADKTLFFSTSLASRVGDPARNAVVAGGGIKFEEEASPVVLARFRKIHPSKKPFFLVLGRKTESKGYDRIIQAIGDLRAVGLTVELVMIGPDDDGVPIETKGVYYYGRQPREVVLGALSTCLCLVTMSYSESFGIVICEAWKFHKPVIANRACYSFRELVSHRKNGLLVGDDDELVSAMSEVARNEALRARLGEAGFDQVISRFTWQNVADEIFRVLVESRNELKPGILPAPSAPRTARRNSR